MANEALTKFFIYNPNYGQKESNDHDKILFYYPSDTFLDDKKSDIGLCMALTSFTETFSKEKPCEAVQTKTHQYVMYQPEKDIWMVLVIKQNKEQIIDDSSLKRIVQMIYQMFKLFNGTFHSIIDSFSVKTLRNKLDLFIPQHLLSLQFDQMDLFDTFYGIRFLPVDKNTYLRIQSFVNLLENSFRPILHTVFFYRDLLVWSGLELFDMRVAYHHVAHNLFPGIVGGEWTKRDYCGFLVGPADLTLRDSPINTPRVFVSSGMSLAEGKLEDTDQECDLIIHQNGDVTVLVFTESLSGVGKDIDFYRRLNEYIIPETASLSKLIGQQYSIMSARGRNEQYKFVYFNNMNLAIKSTLGTELLTQEILGVLHGMHSDFQQIGDEKRPAEVCVKMESGGWVVGRQCDGRELYILFTQKNANLIEINDEIVKLSATYFSNIFLD